MEAAPLLEKKAKAKNNSNVNQNKVVNTIVLEPKAQPVENKNPQIDKTTSSESVVEAKKINYVVTGPIYNPNHKEEKESSDKTENDKTVVKVTVHSIKNVSIESPAQNSSNAVTVNSSKTNETPISSTLQEVGTPAVTPEKIEKTTPNNAHSDANFNAVITSVKIVSKDKRVHTTKDKAETSANQAALVPLGERKAKAKGTQVAKMDEQKTGEFKAIDFKIKLKTKIDLMELPKTEDQADDFESHNNIAQVNNDAKGDVVAAKRNVTGAIESTAKQEPSEANIAQRTAKALPDPKIGSKAVINTNKAMPPKRGDAEIKAPLEKKYQSVEQDLQQNQITDQQLSKSNEPSFNAALSAKNEAKQNVQAAPDKFRVAENNELTSAKATSQGKANANLEEMHSSRKNLLNGVTDNQKQVGTKNTAKSEAAVAKLNDIYTHTKTAVDEQLGSLEATVTTLFDAGAAAAKAAFESHVDQKMKAYKKQRYGSWYDVRGYGKRIGDAVTGLPKEIEAFFVSGRQVFLNTLDGYITQIATIVASRLNSAKVRIASGRQEISNYLKELPNDIKKSIKGDIDAIQGKFNELEETVHQKEADLIDSLATKYKDTLAQVDARIEEMKVANEGLLGMAKRALLAVIEVIKNIKKVLTEILAAAADVIVAIISDPVAFLSNLFGGISEGFTNFGSNILTHLQTGLLGWLTVAMDGMALKMPEDVFSIKGIFSIASQILGFTWDKIRMVGTKVVGEPVMKALETGSELVQILRTDGISGLWEHIKEQFSDLKETVMDAVTGMIQSQVVQAGIKWILGLLTPAGAFVKAAMAIIDVVKFFVQRAAQIMELVQAFITGVKAVASGSIKAVATAIESALGKAIPVVIGFLASLLGIGGLAQKVIGIFKKIHERVEKGLIALWTKIKTLGANLLKKVGIGKKEKSVEKAGKLEDNEVGKVIHFKDDVEDHELWIEKKGSTLEVMVASHDPSPVIRKLVSWEKIKGSKEGTVEQKGAGGLIEKAKVEYNKLMEDAKTAKAKIDAVSKPSSDEKAVKEAGVADKKVETEEESLASIMKQLFVIFGNDSTINAETIAEAHGKFQDITDTANNEVGNQWNDEVPPFITRSEVEAANKKYIENGEFWLWMANYGKSVERYAKEELLGGTEFVAVGGANKPDFIGKSKKQGGSGKYEGLNFDITTVNQNTINTHVYRENKNIKYKNIIITIYKRNEAKFWDRIKKIK
ncbi:hypothetical protein OX283_009360 [Flavobacterium sp. SUN052]|uniref:phage tail protein n=1 Tax=Flavobacterium sp. SUN052 TaxID=3002441 RepID=UPI00237E7FD1|nr:hypothetical protein [Flavobacterium sp. SUN052]MEC4004861.1 hypothetical protein [Flavobacterium sp. SUN052]